MDLKMKIEYTCPFCGSDGKIVPFENIFNDDTLYRPECTSRECPLYIDTGFVTEEDAIKFWNTRHGWTGYL